MDEYYYSVANGQTYSGAQMLALFGMNVETTDITILNIDGFYLVVPSEPDFDVSLYEPIVSYVISGTTALMTWTAVARPLVDAKFQASQTLTFNANLEVETAVAGSGFSVDLLTGVSSQAEIDRAARYQTELESIASIADTLNSNLLAVDAAATVDEINNIVNPPSGVIHIGRTGTDFDPSYYVSFNSSTLTEADTELYIPGTATVVVYGFYVPGEFDTPPGVFNPGDYAIQIREVATSRVIAAFECPEGYEDIAF